MDVKTVDFKAANLDKEFASSMRDTGFAVIRNHLLTERLISDAQEEWRRFFALPEMTKRKYAYQTHGTFQHGYFPFLSENAKDNANTPDLKEFYQLYPGFDMPDEGSFRAALMLRRELIMMGDVLLDALEAHGPEGNPFFKNIAWKADSSRSTMMRAIHYPPVEKQAKPGSVRAAAHEDINYITLLVAGTEPGLQAKDNNGKWYDIPVDKGSIIVNVGDMLQENSEIYKDGKPTGAYYYTSTTHRVVNPEGAQPNVSRLSIPLFIHPHSDIRLSHRYTAEEYLMQRLREIGLIKDEKKEKIA